jgi:hypothetical protein
MSTVIISQRSQGQGIRYPQVASRLNPQLAANAGYRAIMDKMTFPSSAK